MTAIRGYRRPHAGPVVTALAVAALLAVGCSSGSGLNPASRETAEHRLEAIGPKLALVLADYQSGKRQQAYALATSISSTMYEGTAEGIVAKVDLAHDRQLDPLLAATLPYAISAGKPASQVAALVHRAQALAVTCLLSIKHTE